MLFKSGQVRFVEMDDALAAQALNIPSGMNNAPQDSGAFDPFAGEAPFSGGFPNNFGNDRF